MDILPRIGNSLFVPILTTFLRNLGFILYGYSLLDRGTDRVSSSYANQDDRFDFIIVGAGSAGCVLANGLSETHTVLLLEAGGNPIPILNLPTLTHNLHGRDAVIWRHYTESQTQASFGSKDNKTLWNRGKGLGGSSYINGMVYIRGNTFAYDEIAKRTGDPRWKTENILKYFRKVENYNGWFKPTEHGKQGKTNIEKGHQSKLIKYYLKAGEELGYPIRDPNPPNHSLTDGFAPMDFYMKNGSRHSSYQAYIQPVLDRPNLTVRRYAFVKKILMQNNRAYGVAYDHHGVEKKAFINNDVILSAGSLASPKLLMLAGIGPRHDLEKLDIKLKVDLPVGQHLQDKYGALIGPFISDRNTTFKIDRDTNVRNLLTWYRQGTGPMKTSLIDASFSIASSLAKREGTANDPDIHTYCMSVSMSPDLKDVFTTSWNFNDAMFNHLVDIPEGKDSFYQLVTVAKPRSSGYVRLKDTDPYSFLIADPKYLHHPRDVKVLTEAIRIAVRTVDDTKSMEEINAYLLKKKFPGCEKYKFKTDPYFECLGRHATLTAYKYGGTAPIGAASGDPEAVVDSHFRVIGTKGLRVIDGSVLQEKLVSVDDFSMRMIGLVGVDIIKEDWNIK